jgi:hypothetical protein
MRLGFGSLQNPVQLPAQGSAGCAIADRDPIWPGEFRGWTRGRRWWLPNHATSFVEHSFNIFSWVHHGSPGYQDFDTYLSYPRVMGPPSICGQVENITTWRHLKGIGWRAQHWENQKLQRSTPRAHVQMYSWALESVPWICTDVQVMYGADIWLLGCAWQWQLVVGSIQSILKTQVLHLSCLGSIDCRAAGEACLLPHVLCKEATECLHVQSTVSTCVNNIQLNGGPGGELYDW